MSGTTVNMDVEIRGHQGRVRKSMSRRHPIVFPRSETFDASDTTVFHTDQWIIHGVLAVLESPRRYGTDHSVLSSIQPLLPRRSLQIPERIPEPVPICATGKLSSAQQPLGNATGILSPSSSTQIFLVALAHSQYSRPDRLGNRSPEKIMKRYPSCAFQILGQSDDTLRRLRHSRIAPGRPGSRRRPQSKANRPQQRLDVTE